MILTAWGPGWAWPDRPPEVWAAVSLFAPETKKSETPETKPEALAAEEKPVAAENPAPEPAAGAAEGIVVEDLAAPGDQAPVPMPAASGGGSEILMDAMGNKTLVIRGDEPPKVLTDDQGGRTQVLLGDDTAGLMVDDQGNKTLVVRGSFSPAPPEGAETPRRPEPAEAGAPARTQPAAPPAGEKPYWLVEAPPSEVPYYLAHRQQENVPYWRVTETEDSGPYWRVDKAPVERPYWELEPEVVEIIASEVQPGPVSVATALPPGGVRVSDSNSSDSRTISWYMYEDERGVKHLTNTPTDPRYRLFTAVVKMQRGLSSPKMRFTHNSLRPIIMKAATVYNLDPALIAAVIKSESAFDSQAVSWAGAQGLMQLMPGTARDMGVRNPFDPEENVMGGSRYLRLMLNRFKGDLTLAIAAYNAGPERVARNWRVPNIAETQNYVKIVTRNYERYKFQF